MRILQRRTFAELPKKRRLSQKVRIIQKARIAAAIYCNIRPWGLPGKGVCLESFLLAALIAEILLENFADNFGRRRRGGLRNLFKTPCTACGLPRGRSRSS